LLTSSGYARSDGRIGTRNYIALVATVNCSATVIRRAASETAASRLLEDYASVDGVVALAHGTGCGMANSGRGFDILDRVLWGHAIHPNVGATVFVGLGGVVAWSMKSSKRALPETEFRRCVGNWGGQVRYSD
jgi:altronate hydrolase